MRKIGRNNIRVQRERRPRAPLPVQGQRALGSVLDREALLTTGLDDLVWVMATTHSVQNLSARVRSDLPLADGDCLDVAARLITKKYASYDDFFHATRDHPYMCFTTVGLWSKRLKALLGESGGHLSDEVIGEWFWTVFRKVL